MKKLFLGTRIIAVATTASAGFTGGYAGLKVDHAWTKFSASDTTTQTSIDNNISGFEADLFGGYGLNAAADWIYGFEGHIGHGFSEATKGFSETGITQGNLKNRRLWKLGVAARVGRTFNGNVLAYARLGIHMNQYEYRVTAQNVQAAKSTFASWEIAPGVGVEYAFNDSVNGRLEYVYEYAMNTKEVNFGGRKFKINRPKTNVVTLGVSFAL